MCTVFLELPSGLARDSYKNDSLGPIFTAMFPVTFAKSYMGGHLSFNSTLLLTAEQGYPSVVTETHMKLDHFFSQQQINHCVDQIY